MAHVDPESLRRLLEVQEQDIAIMRLEARRASLPEAQRLAEVGERLAELSSDIGIATKQLDEITTENNRLEGEIQLGEQKIEREEKRLFSGGVSNPKELGALQQEVEMLKKQRSTLEDRLLEVMERREQSESMLERLRGEHDGYSAEGRELQNKLDAATAEIDAALSDHRARRGELAVGLPEALIDLYEQIRAQKGGIGAAALMGSVCQGCHTALPAKEVERIRNAGGLQRCDNCRRILVVT